MVVVADAVDELASQPPWPRLRLRLRRPSKATLLEVLLVGISPLVLFFVLRLRPMAPGVMPDPSMHTAYIIDPRDFFARFTSELLPRAGTREGARVGFLIPARLLYLCFGAVRGFFVFRYLLALVAVVPSYVLLRRLYGRAAGAAAIVILMSSPVLVTAWGTDYPDSAVVSYMTAGLACLAMPCREQRRRTWLALAAVMLTLAVWSSVAAAPLVVATMLVYVVLCFGRDRHHMLSNLLVLGGTAVAVTAAMMLASGVLLGPFDYIGPTIRAYTYLNSPATVIHYHSPDRDWILLRPYLLAPAGAIVAWGAAFLGRLRSIPTSQLLIGTACVVQVAVYSYLQFLGDAETLEQHYYSSSLWAAVCLVLAVSVAALAKPLLDHRLAQWLPAVGALGLPLVYETDPHLPAFGWLPIGLVIVAAVLVAAAIGRVVVSRAAAIGRPVAVAVVVVVIGCSLMLTAAPYERHSPLAGVIDDPVPAYATALGGSDGNLVDQYRVVTEIPQFVGNSTYPNERLLMWFPQAQLLSLVEIIGIYHATFNSLGSSPTVLTFSDKQILAMRQPAEILVFNTPDFPATLRALAPYDPRLLRAKVFTSGDFVLHAWLISLGVFAHKPSA